jgi:hypothetical protein
MSRAKISDLQALQNRIERFQREKFPGQPLRAKLRHMGHELTELKRDVDDEMEWADVFILLLGSAATYGFTTSNLIALANRKMDINDNRKWSAPDAHGVCHHID